MRADGQGGPHRPHAPSNPPEKLRTGLLTVFACIVIYFYIYIVLGAPAHTYISFLSKLLANIYKCVSGTSRALSKGTSLSSLATLVDLETE